MKFFEVEQQGQTSGITAGLAYTLLNTGIRTTMAMVIGGICAALYFGIDYVGKLSAGVDPGEDFILSVAVTVAFFSLAYGILGLIKRDFLTISPTTIGVGKQWIFGPPILQEVDRSGLGPVRFEPRSGVRPHAVVVTNEGGETLTLFSSWLAGDELRAFVDDVARR